MIIFSVVPLLMAVFYSQINEEYGVLAGDPSPSTLIVGGRDVSSAKSWPWQAGIVVPREGFVCGGTLIDLTTVLTAAHCVDRSRNGTITVVLGEFDRRVTEGYEQYIPVRDISKHPSYRNDFLSGYDIALLHLSTGATVTSRVIPIPAIARRKQKFTKPSTDCYITGWGVSTLDNSPRIPLTKNDTEPDQEKKECFKNEVPKIVGSYGGLAVKLQEASINVITNSQCNSKQYWNGMVKSTNICAFHRDKAACESADNGSVCHGRHNTNKARWRKYSRFPLRKDSGAVIVVTFEETVVDLWCVGIEGPMYLLELHPGVPCRVQITRLSLPKWQVSVDG